MRLIRGFVVVIMSALILVPMLAAQVSAGTGVQGVVRDPSGATIPGAVVTLKDLGTGAVKTAQTSADGHFTFPDLQAATYSLSVSKTGFQPANYATVAVDTGRVTDLQVRLQLGTSTQAVEVTGTPAELQTSTTAISTTVDNKAIADLPYASRDTLQFALLSAGSQIGSGRNDDFNNLPNASMNISLDGMNNNSQRFKSGGTSFFSFAPARINAMQEVTITTAGNTASDLTGGAMQMRFTTKRGTDQYHINAGWQFANWALNANSYFNNLHGQPINKSRQNNPFIGVGGPLWPGNKKLYFFAYFEAQPQPGSSIDTTTILTPASQAGNFVYQGTDGQQHTVNVYTAAQAAGINNVTQDATVAAMLNTANSSQKLATGTLPITGQPYWQTMEWEQPNHISQYFPTGRLDYQISNNLDFHASENLRYENIAGSAPPYPGLSQYAFSNGYKITTYTESNGLDWAISPNLVNNFTFGIQSNGEYFSHGSDPTQFAPWGNRIISTPLIAATIPNVLPFIRNNPVYQVRDDFTWNHGAHTTQWGGSLLHTSFWETSFGSAGIPDYSLGVASGDPLTSAAFQNQFPGINTQNGDLGNAESLFALLTGRVSSVSGNVNVDEKTHKYAEFQGATQRWAFSSGSLYLQDAWRATPNLTLNYGLAWELDGPIKTTNGIDGEPDAASFFGGAANPQFNQVAAPYKSSLGNVGPSVGFAWNPGGSGPLSGLLGDHKTVVRGSYAVSYYSEGMNTISNTITENPGSSQSLFSNFAPGSLNLTSPPPAFSSFPTSFGFPFPESEFAFGFQPLGFVNPNLRTPYTESWTFGLQRQLTNKTVVEARYVGNASHHMWHFQNIDQVNITSNGFLTQFQQAQANLAANLAAGKKGFANNGLPGQNPTPIFDAAFKGLPASQGYSSGSLIVDLQQGVAGTMAGVLSQTSTFGAGYYCNLVGTNFSPCAQFGYSAPGAYTATLFSPNPYAGGFNSRSGGMFYQDDNGDNNYNGLQLEVRHTFGHGLSYNANFVWSHSLGDLLNASDQTAGDQWLDIHNARLSYGPTPFDQRFAWNSFWTYDLPLGRGRLISSGSDLVNNAIGGWTLGGTEQIETGTPVLLTSGRDTVSDLASSGVALSLPTSQLQQSLTTRDGKVVNGSLGTAARDQILGTGGIPNPSTYGPASTPGSYGQIAFLRNVPNVSLNMSLNKQIRISERAGLNLRVEDINFLNHPFFNLANTSPTSSSFGLITSTTGSSTRTILLRTEFNW